MTSITGPLLYPLPADGAVSGWRERVQHQWRQWQSTFKLGTAPTDPDETQFVTWEDINRSVQLLVLHEFQLSPGMKTRIRPELFDADEVTEMDVSRK